MISNISGKIEIAHDPELTDYHFIGELMTASKLADSPTIQRVIMNSENPKNNMNKMIVAGNNAQGPFSRHIAAIPYTSDLQNYSITNESINLPDVQSVRIQKLEKITLAHPRCSHINETLINIQYINKLDLELITKNIKIQEEIFKMFTFQEVAQIFATTLRNSNPSFYAAYVI